MYEVKFNDGDKYSRFSGIKSYIYYDDGTYKFTRERGSILLIHERNIIYINQYE